jgi:hypothetical protein
MYLGSDSKVYILDKAENNPARIEGRFGPHPAWAVEYDWATQDGTYNCVCLCCCSDAGHGLSRLAIYCPPIARHTRTLGQTT